MVRTRFRWLGVSLAGFITALPACREQPPVPPYNHNLGGEGELLLPTPLSAAESELTGNRGVTIPLRSEAAQVKQRAETPPPAAAPSAPPEKKHKGVVSDFLGRLRGGPAAGAPPAEAGGEPKTNPRPEPGERGG